MSANDSELLDHFAGLAMQGMLANSRFDYCPLGSEDVNFIVVDAYGIAEAMLAERAKRMQPADLTDLPFGGAK